MNIAQAPVRDTGGAGGEDLGGMDAGAGRSRWHTEAQEHGGAGETVGHADRAIHQLRRETDGDEEQNIIPHTRVPPRFRQEHPRAWPCARWLPERDRSLTWEHGSDPLCLTSADE